MDIEELSGSALGKNRRLPAGDHAKGSLAPTLPGTVVLEPSDASTMATTPPAPASRVPGAGCHTTPIREPSGEMASDVAQYPEGPSRQSRPVHRLLQCAARWRRPIRRGFQPPRRHGPRISSCRMSPTLAAAQDSRVPASGLEEDPLSRDWDRLGRRQESLPGS
jgi:hypothetical protein